MSTKDKHRTENENQIESNGEVKKMYVENNNNRPAEADIQVNTSLVKYNINGYSCSFQSSIYELTMKPIECIYHTNRWRRNQQHEKNNQIKW